MNRLEEKIAGTLRNNAVTEVDVAALLDASRERGRVYRRRRRAWQVAAGTVVAVVALVGGAVSAPRLAGRGLVDGPARMTPAPSQSPDGLNALTGYGLPLVPDAVPAIEDPSVIGTDPSLVHFDLSLADLPGPPSTVRWASRDGVESLTGSAPAGTAQMQPAFQFDFTFARDQSQLGSMPAQGGRQVSVRGRTATLTSGDSDGYHYANVRWQPIDGMWAQLTLAASDDAAIGLAGRVRFDTALRCAVPFSLDWLPAGATTTSCIVGFGGRPHGEVTVRYGKTEGRGNSFDGFSGPPTTTVGGRPATVQDVPPIGGQPSTLQVSVDLGGHGVDLIAQGDYDRDTVLRIAAGFRDVSGDPVETWPSVPG